MNFLSFDIRIIFLAHKIWPHSLPKRKSDQTASLFPLVKENILTDMKEAKCFSLMFDSTPDASHIDRMSEVIRYVHIENKKVELNGFIFRLLSAYRKKSGGYHIGNLK